MSFMIILRSIETVFDHMMNRVERELIGSTSSKGKDLIKFRDPCPTHAKRRRKSFVKVISTMKKIIGELPMAIGKKSMLKKLNIYKFVPSIRKTTLLTLIKTKEDRQLYSMHYLDRNDFKNRTSMKPHAREAYQIQLTL
ncbi:hypothetical protein H5410_060580 [Solanum commersonii]|uniref:Uncharacterized protein n=1 Tax=Solanum commersonii TaxID=4109 RepID=A0A9J5W701_SOLCO|nr:hypothetical protein H5410_060580 [Solanum commersonii]